MSNIDHLDKGKAIMSKERATNWELHDGAEDGYLDEEKDSTSDPEENMPLARTFSVHTTPDVTIRTSDPLSKRKAVMGGNLYRKVTNRKNRALILIWLRRISSTLQSTQLLSTTVTFYVNRIWL